MLKRRLIVCMDVRDGRVVKGTRFVDLRDVGDPVDLAARYESEGADEIVFLDISATLEGRMAILEVAQRAAARLFIPLTIGGGVRSVGDVSRALRAGADKVAINSAAVTRPALLGEAAAIFGAQCVVSSIDARRSATGWNVVTHGARISAGLNAIDWARRCAAHGAGEILLTSVDRDGSREGYDIELTSAVSTSVSVPVIASGGAGTATHVTEAIQSGHADAALVAGIVHDGTTTVSTIKAQMRAALLDARLPA